MSTNEEGQLNEIERPCVSIKGKKSQRPQGSGKKVLTIISI